MNYLKLYKKYLPFTMIPSISVSYAIGIINVKSDVFYPQEQMLNVLGLLSVGTFIGISYPVSMPLLAGRYLYLNRI